MHTCQRRRSNPVNNADYWQRKRSGNVSRDKRNAAALRRCGWKVLTVWECQTRDAERLAAKIAAFLAG